MDPDPTGYFLPDDWILWRSGGRLSATRLSSGEQLEIEAGPELDIFDQERSNAIWASLVRFEPLLGQLRARLREQPLVPLTQGSVLRGSGWKQLFDDTRTGRAVAGVEFRFVERLDDESTAHQTGIFRYTFEPEGGTPAVAMLHFEALLVRKDGAWLMVMEYQKQPATDAEWDAAR